MFHIYKHICNPALSDKFSFQLLKAASRRLLTIETFLYSFSFTVFPLQFFLYSFSFTVFPLQFFPYSFSLTAFPLQPFPYSFPPTTFPYIRYSPMVWYPNPCLPMIPITCSRHAGGMLQDRPQPADICLGTGIRRPGTSSLRQTVSMAMASAVVWNVITSLSSFFLICFTPVSRCRMAPAFTQWSAWIPVRPVPPLPFCPGWFRISSHFLLCGFR